MTDTPLDDEPRATDPAPPEPPPPPRPTPAPSAREPDALRFEDDPGARRSTWIALGIAGALILWMGSGFVFSEEEAAPELAREAVPPVSVAITASVAEPVTRVFSAEMGRASCRERFAPCRSRWSPYH